MKKIINGKLYNTETATLIGWFYKGGTSHSDFNYIEQQIYKTKKWQYFLYIWGWARTQYATRIWNSSSGGTDIELMTIESITEWLEENNQYLHETTLNNFLSIIPLIEG